jgi:lytic murein transglycosylase
LNEGTNLAMRLLILVLLSISGMAAPAAADFASCVAGLRNAAAKSGIGRPLAARALGLTAPDEKVLRLSQSQPEFTIPIWDYVAVLVDDKRIADGRAMLRRHDATFRAAEARFGVDRHVIAAVWGAESDYGQEQGDHFLPHALATLACAGSGRRNFWRSELFVALKLVARGDLALDKLYGSWAGAFGHTQFIPSVYQRLAVDFDGDGRRDLVGSIPDALASTANYLRRARWQAGAPWMLEVRVPPGYAGLTGRRPKAPLADWARRGILRADGAPLAGHGVAGLLLPAGAQGPGFLAFPNYDAIYAYNHADSYAIAISLLAHRLAGGPPLTTPWPTDDPGLSRAERLHLQQLLIAKGYNPGKPDGKVGPTTREAIMQAEQRLGWPPTGRPGRKIYRALGGR